MKDTLLENSVVTLHSRGCSINRLSKELCVSRERIRRILRDNTNNRLGTQPKPRKKRDSKLDAYKEDILNLSIFPDEEKALELEKKILEQTFTLADFRDQLHRFGVWAPWISWLK